MLSNGNGDAEITANNLIKIIRGEVAFDRIRGINLSYIDNPLGEIKSDIENDVYETLEDYEPRVDVKDVSITKKENGTCSIELSLDIVNEQVTEYE